MTTTEKYPKIRRVIPSCDKTLWVVFENGVSKVYDCKPLLEDVPFRPLADDALFMCAHADTHGYGVIWNDEIDLAESEIWLHGKECFDEHVDVEMEVKQARRELQEAILRKAI